MNESTECPAVTLYALRLTAADPRDPEALVGCVEHVLSGRQHAFRSGRTLLALLAGQASPERRDGPARASATQDTNFPGDPR